MLCLSVHDPWASALVHGAKTIETRTWPGRGLRPGDWIAIQVSRTMSHFDLHIQARWRAFDPALGPERSGRRELGPKRAGTGLLHEIASLVEKCPHHGCIIGAVRFEVGYHYSSYPGRFAKEEKLHLIPVQFSDGSDLVAWKMDDFFAIHPPIPWRGELGLFNVPFEIDPRIAEKGVKRVHRLVRIGEVLSTKGHEDE